MTWRFHSPPGWPRPSVGFTPPPGWLPDPSWPPAPPGWNFWIDDAGTVPDERLLTAEDGTAVLEGSTLTLRFTVGSWQAPFKAAVGMRTYPLDAIADVVFRAPGSARTGSLSVTVKPGRDTLRRFLKDEAPSAGSDPDCLVVAPTQAAAAELFAARVRAAASRPAASGAMVSTGRLPIEVRGADGTAGFDGRHLTLAFGGWTADPAKRLLGTRVLAAASILDVQVRHPGMSGWIRFVTADAPVEPDLPATSDPHTLCLNADAARRHVVLAAAVTRSAPALSERVPSVPIERKPLPSRF